MKTTSLGIIGIVVALGNVAQAVLKGTPIDYAEAVNAIILGIGLIRAADHKKV